MGKLNLGVEIRDFDLERMGISMSVLDENKKRQSSEAYIRMTLPELSTLLAALRADDEIDVSTVENSAAAKMGRTPARADGNASFTSTEPSRNGAGPGDDSFLSMAIKEKLSGDMRLNRGSMAAIRSRPVKT